MIMIYKFTPPPVFYVYQRNAHLMSSNEELEQKTARVEADLTTLEQRWGFTLLF